MTAQKMNEKNETKRRTFDPLEEPTAELALLFICIVMSHITHLHWKNQANSRCRRRYNSNSHNRNQTINRRLSRKRLSVIMIYPDTGIRQQSRKILNMCGVCVVGEGWCSGEWCAIAHCRCVDCGLRCVADELVANEWFRDSGYY